MFTHPHRRAWFVLFASLLACCAFSIGVPTAAISFVNNASEMPRAFVQLQAGKVSTFETRETESADAKVVALNGRVIEEGMTVIVDNDADSVGAVAIETPNRDATIFLQLYAGSRLRVEQLRVPRYTLSAQPDHVILVLEQGRAEVQVRYPASRKLALQLRLPIGSGLITQSGTYIFEVTNKAVVARVVRGELFLQDGRLVRENATMTTNRATGVSQENTPTRNVIRNGTFIQPLNESNWVVSSTAQINQPLGKVFLANGGLILQRTGTAVGPGRTSATQQLNQAIASRSDVRLHVAFTIREQEIPVCGSTGSECPLMLIVVYERDDGSEGRWYQGFFGVGVPFVPLETGTGVAQLPDYIVSNRQSKHIYKPLNLEANFTSDNLLRVVPNIKLIKSIALEAQGHSVHTQVNEVALWLQD